MSDSEQYRFDSILLALAEQHKEGVPEVISEFEYRNRMARNKIVYWWRFISVTGNVGWIFSSQNRLFCWRKERWMANGKQMRNINLPVECLLRLWCDFHHSESYKINVWILCSIFLVVCIVVARYFWRKSQTSTARA